MNELVKNENKEHSLENTPTQKTARMKVREKMRMNEPTENNTEEKSQHKTNDTRIRKHTPQESKQQ